MLYPFPALPDVLLAAPKAAPLLKGTVNAETIHAAWVVASYGLGLYLPDPPASLSLADAPLTDVRAAQLLESTAGNPQAFSVIPWGEIAQLLLPILLRWLAKRG